MYSIKYNDRYKSKFRLKFESLDEFLQAPLIKLNEIILPENLGKIMKAVCKRHDVLPYHVLSGSRSRGVVDARREFIAIMHFKYRYTPEDISQIMKLDRTSVLHHLGMRKHSKVAYADLRDQYR